MITKKLPTDMRFLLGIIITLIFVGFLFIYSASSVYALEKYKYPSYFLYKQIIGSILGLLGFYVCYKTPPPCIQKITPMLFIVSLLLTACTLIPGLGIKIHGSSRWVGFGVFSLQPSELLKISFIMMFAYLLSAYEFSKKKWKLYSYAFFLIFLVNGVLLKQPDFGMAVTTTFAGLALLFIMDMDITYIIIALIASIPTTVYLIYQSPYRWHRITTFLDPWHDPHGSGFQVIQSLIAIGSGGFWGTGISHSKQKFFYLPMQHTDFIFSIIAEETGFLGAFCIIFLYSLILFLGLRIAWKIEDKFALLVTIGFILMISFQACINIAMAAALIPTKGTGLPFISYGKSSLICSMCMIGIIMNYARHYIKRA